MASIFDKIYLHSPIWMQNVGISLYGIGLRQRRYGGHFTKMSNQFRQREEYSEEQWIQYQTYQLRRIILYAYENVPYFRDLFIKVGFQKKDMQNMSLSELKYIPVLNKEVIRKNPDLFISRKMKFKHYNTYWTSGTTGTPLAVKWTLKTERMYQAAHEIRVRNWANVNYKMSRAMIGGRIVVPKAESEPPFWRYNLIERQLYMSAFHISPKSVKDYVNAINKYKPEYLVGYASSHYFLARFIKNQGLHVHQPKAVLTSSEKLTPEMRELIESVYHCKVFDAYNGVEGSCLISECENHRLHVSPDVGIVEILNSSGNSQGDGEYGEVITTGLLNFDQPLIRYRMGDLACYAKTDCPCGRKMKVVEDIIGRIEDVVVGRDGREMVRFHGIFTGINTIREGQVIQDDIDRFTVKLAVDSTFNDVDRAEIQNRFYQRLGTIKLRLEIVDRIERTSAGKIKSVVSNLSKRI